MSIFSDNQIGFDSFEHENTQTKPSLQYGNNSDAWDNSIVTSDGSFLKYQDAISGKLDLNVEMKNLASFRMDSKRDYRKKPQDIRNEASYREKQRIRDQERSAEHNRKDDFFAIGTVYLEIPPTQISVSEEGHNYRFKTLRGSADSITMSGRSVKRIDLEILFNGLDDINNKLRPLIAQFKCTPFLPITNSYIRTLVEPESKGIMSDIDSTKESISALEKARDVVEQMDVFKSNKIQAVSRLLSEIQSMASRKLIDDGQSSRMRTTLQSYCIGGRLDLAMQDNNFKKNLHVVSPDGKQILDIKGYISDVISVNNQDGSSIVQTTMSISNIDKLRQEIDAIEKNAASLVDINAKERYLNRQIVGVLSQMTLSTMPGYPETLSCRLSMHVFNYEPYMFNFGFVKGYEPKSYTPDIGECDIFIDWYSKRFLGNGPDSLGMYSTDDSIEFRYAKDVVIDDLIKGGEPKISVDSVGSKDDGDETYVSGISVSMRNIVQFIPILSSPTPTCQYVGAYNSSVQININSTNIDKINKLKGMMSTLARIARRDNKLSRYNMFMVINPLISLCGLKYFIADTFSVDTVPGNPGLYSMTLDIAEIKLGMEKEEQLDRISTTNNTDVWRAAEYIISSASKYMQDTSPGHSLTANYRQYYDFLFNGFGDKDIKKTIFYNSIKHGVSNSASTLYSDYYKDGSGSAAANRIFSNMSPDKVEKIIEDAASGRLRDQKHITEPPVISYAKNMKSVMSGGVGRYEDGSVMDFSSELPFLSHALADYQMDAIKRRIIEGSTGPGGMVDMRNYVLGLRLKEVGNLERVIDPTCYPDLKLPTYDELGDNGDKFKLTYGDIGLLTPNPIMVNKTPQIDFVSIEPDAFYSKINFREVIDGVDNPAMETGLKTFQYLSECNSYTHGSPQDPSSFVRKIRESTDANDVSNFLDPNSSRNIESKVSSAIDDRLVRVIKAVGGNTFEVIPIDPITKEDADSETYTIRITDYEPAEYEGGNWWSNITASKEISNKNTDIANKVLKGKIIKAQVLPGEVTGFGGKKSVGVIAYIVDLDTNQDYDIKDLMKNNKMKFVNETDNIDQRVNVFKEEDKEIFGDVVFRSAKNTKTAVVLNKIQDPAEKKKAEGLKKDNPVVSIGAKVEYSKTDIIGTRYIIGSDDPNYKSKNRTFKRFDRMAPQHIERIIERIKGQAKDHKLRMVRAFPTFKFYFVQDNNMEWKPLEIFPELSRLDSLYSYNAIMSVDITKSRKEAADVAVVRILNTKGILDRSQFGLYDEKNDFRQTERIRNQKYSAHDTLDDQETMEEFILKIGTRIRIKMGYSSDPSMLDNVFTGQIAEVEMGDIITIIAQGYGYELEKKITGWGSKIHYQDFSAYKILDKLMSRPEIVHFGRMEYEPIDNISSKKFYRRYKPDSGFFKRLSYTAFHPSMWRQHWLMAWLLRNIHDPRNDNIWTPEVSAWAEETHGDPGEFLCENRTVWDVFQEFTRRLPGYIAQVIPFDNRATIYFGPPDGYYSYSNEVRGLIDEEKASFEDQDSLIQGSLNNGTIRQLTQEESSDLIERVNSILDKYNRITSLNWSQTETYGMVGGPQKLNEIITSNYNYATPVTVAAFSTNISARLAAETRYQATWVLNGAEEFLSSINMDDDRKLVEDFRKINDGQGSFYRGTLAKSFYSGGKFYDTDALRGIPMYVDKDGNYYDKESYIRLKYNDALRMPANMRLIRGYHYFDSFRNIVSNNIRASEENMWNRVEVITSNKSAISGNIMSMEAVNPLKAIRAQVDDNIARENLITKVVSEPNANTPTNAWLYAIGNLGQGVNEMYTGSLTILGDPTIKPYDVVFINDYFTEMHGAFQVREVTHHFSHETGFVTNIVPDCICYANNSMAMSQEAAAGGWYDGVASSLSRVYNFKIMFANRIPFINIAESTIGANIRQAASSLMYLVGGWSMGRREPINFLPLIYANRPYIAGVRGMRRSSWYTPAIEGLRKLWYFHVIRAPRYLTETFEQYMETKLTSGTGAR
jgi:hypothetical protein